MTQATYWHGTASRLRTHFGLGVNPQTRKTVFASCFSNPSQPGAKRILIDYNSAITTSGNNVRTNNFTTGRALMVAGRGDRILMPGGQSTVPDGTAGNGGTRPIPGRFEISGASLQYPVIVGTYDPADPYNEARDNVLYHKWDFTDDPVIDKWNGVNSTIIFNRLVATDFVFITNQIFDCGVTVAASDNSHYSTGWQNVAIFSQIVYDGLGVEDCVADGIRLMNSQINGHSTATPLWTDTGLSKHGQCRMSSCIDNVNLNGAALGGTSNRGFIQDDNIFVRSGNPTRLYSDAEVANADLYTSAAGNNSYLGNRTIRMTDVNTANLKVGDYLVGHTACSFGPTNQGVPIMAILNSTDVRVSTMLSGTAPNGTTSTLGVRRISANDRRHATYWDGGNLNMFAARNLNIQDSSNNKVCGGPWNITEWFDISCPLGYITSPRGNAAFAVSPQHCYYNAQGGISVRTDDIAYQATFNRGDGPWLNSQQKGYLWGFWQTSKVYALGDVVQRGVDCYACMTAGTSGTTMDSAPRGRVDGITDGTVTWNWAWPAGDSTANGQVMGNRNNPAGTAANGAMYTVQTDAPGQTTNMMYADWRNTIVASWNNPANTASEAYLTKTYTACITDDTAGFLNTTQAAVGNGGASTGTANLNRTATGDATLSFPATWNFHNMFRYSMPQQLGGVTIGGVARTDEIQGEYDIGRILAYSRNKGHIERASRLYRGTVGR